MVDALPPGGLELLRLRPGVIRRRFNAPRITASLGMLVALVVNGPVAADPARFWISTSNVLPSGPVAPNIPGVEGSLRYLHIWAQPATVNSGAFNSTTNQFKQLENFTLNLVTTAPAVQFLNNSIVVYNPTLGETAKRFETIDDSSVGLASSVGDGGFNSDYDDIYGIYGIAGVNVSGGSEFLGIGGSACNANDPYCATTTNGSPAWLLASMASRTLATDGSTEYRLHIGRLGMNHVGEGSSAMSVVFGAGEGPVYNGRTNREVTLGGDTADFTVQAVPQSAATEPHWSGGDGQWDQLVGGSPPSFLNNVVLDGGVVTLSGAQQANKTTINGGRLHIDGGSSLASEVVVGAGGAISGSGWVGSNLTLGGSLVTNSTGPLLVAGSANLSGGSLSLAPGYTQSFTVSSPFTVLVAEAGLQGTLNTASLGPGFALESIEYGSKSVTIQVRSTGLIGDYNGDSAVDAADYVVWRNTFDDGGAVTEDDYTTWKSHFGLTTGGGGSVASATPVVPEPATAIMILTSIYALTALSRFRLRLNIVRI